MTKLDATYFDGRSSAAHAVEVRIGPAGEMLVQGSGFEHRYPLRAVRIAPRIGNAPRAIYLPDGGKCETRDNDAVDRATAGLKSGRVSRLVHAFESRLPLIGAALAATVLLGWATIEYGVPYLAREIAYALPREVDQRLSHGALEGLDYLVLGPSRLAPEVRQRLTEAFAELVETAGPKTPVRLEFRSSAALGPNALALPSGIVVLTDELVEIAGSNEELVAVLAHELGHIEGRHAVRGALQNSITPVLIATVTGDLASITALSGTLPTFLIQMKHSRAFEREADDYARATLARMGIPHEHFAAILRRLAQAHGERDDGLGAYLSTHPGTEERLLRLNAGSE